MWNCSSSFTNYLVCFDIFVQSVNLNCRRRRKELLIFYRKSLKTRTDSIRSKKSDGRLNHKVSKQRRHRGRSTHLSFFADSSFPRYNGKNAFARIEERVDVVPPVISDIGVLWKLQKFVRVNSLEVSDCSWAVISLMFINIWKGALDILKLQWLVQLNDHLESNKWVRRELKLSIRQRETD